MATKRLPLTINFNGDPVGSMELNDEAEQLLSSGLHHISVGGVRQEGESQLDVREIAIVPNNYVPESPLPFRGAEDRG